MVYSVFQLLQHDLSYVQFYCNGIEHHFQTCVLVSLLAYVTPYIHFKRTTVSDFLNYCSETWSCDDYFALTAMKSQTNQYINNIVSGMWSDVYSSTTMSAWFTKNILPVQTAQVEHVTYTCKTLKTWGHPSFVSWHKDPWTLNLVSSDRHHPPSFLYISNSVVQNDPDSSPLTWKDTLPYLE